MSAATDMPFFMPFEYHQKDPFSCYDAPANPDGAER